MSKIDKEEVTCGMFPPIGIQDYKPEHDYPTRFTDFHWWSGSVKKMERDCFNTIRRDEIPIPPLHDERWRYPYRYSSAGPTKAGISVRERERRYREDKSKEVKVKKTVEARDIRQIPGYETTSMESSLQPFTYHTPTEIVTKDIPAALLTPTWAPKCAHTDFGEYVLRQLHPRYDSDIKTRRRIQFATVDANRELCVTMKELEHLNASPQKKKKKKDFLFVQQRPGHRPLQEAAPDLAMC